MMSEITTLTNLQAAFSRVEASKGMGGVDRVTIAAFKRELAVNLAILLKDLREGSYGPLPLLRFLVAKADGSPRVLTVPTVRDRVAQAAVLNVTEALFEAEFEDVSFAYRKGRSVKQAAYRIKELREQGYRYIVEADVDAFFDNIDQNLLMAKVAQVISDSEALRLIRLWVTAEVYDGKKIFVLQSGIPQGTVVSPTLANLFLDEFDEAIIARGHQLVRYSDDFIVLARTRSEAESALEFTEETLAHLHLNLDEEDTGITDFRTGFKYLGLIFLEDSILSPFDRPKKIKQILYMPPPFDLKGYLAGKRAWP